MTPTSSRTEALLRKSGAVLESSVLKSCVRDWWYGVKNNYSAMKSEERTQKDGRMRQKLSMERKK